jgi:butyrate kinase
LFDGRVETTRVEIRHDREELLKFDTVPEQWSHRLRAVEEFLAGSQEKTGEGGIDAVIAPSGVVRGLNGGVYVVDRKFLEIVKKCAGQGRSIDLGAPLADALSRSRKARAFSIVSISSDELDPLSRISGLPDLLFSRWPYTLRVQDAIIRASDEMGRQLSELSLIVAYLGTNFMICSYKNGRVLDLSSSNERGPFSTTKSGALPAAELVRHAYSGMWSMDSLLEKVNTHGGMKSYVGTENLNEISRLDAAGDVYSGLILRAMAYQTAQEICAQAAVLKGGVDAVVLAGTCVENDAFVELIHERIRWITDKILHFRGGDGLKIMANFAFRVLNGDERAILPHSEWSVH